jgi:signal transduction histidine kinase
MNPRMRIGDFITEPLLINTKMSKSQRRQRAEEALQQSREELRALARRLESFREEQAARIARELHDELGQSLTILKLHVRSLQKKLEAHRDEPPAFEGAEAIDLIESAVRSVRHLCTELRPPALDHLGLRPAIETLAAEFQARSGIGCLLCAPAELPVLDTQSQTTVYRIVQELLTNVARHAAATEVRITFLLQREALHLEVADNGRGIAPHEMAGTGSLGLLGMRERALAAGGQITLEGKPGHGTTARAHIPLASPRELP